MLSIWFKSLDCIRSPSCLAASFPRQYVASPAINRRVASAHGGPWSRSHGRSQQLQSCFDISPEFGGSGWRQLPWPLYCLKLAHCRLGLAAKGTWNDAIRIQRLIGLLVLAGDIWAIINIFQSSVSNQKKLIWIIAVVLLPVLGLILWYFLGPRNGRSN